CNHQCRVRLTRSIQVRSDPRGRRLSLIQLTGATRYFPAAAGATPWYCGSGNHVGDLHSVIRFLRNYQQRRRIQRKLPDPAQLQEQLAAWLQTPLGERLLRSQKAQLAPVLSRIFGYHILQISSSRDVSLLDESPVGHKIVFSPVWREDCS